MEDLLLLYVQRTLWLVYKSLKKNTHPPPVPLGLPACVNSGIE